MKNAVKKKLNRSKNRSLDLLRQMFRLDSRREEEATSVEGGSSSGAAELNTMRQMLGKIVHLEATSENSLSDS